MNNKQLAEIAKILGVSEESISAMDDEIRNSMTKVFEIAKDKKALYESLDDLWQKGSVYVELHEVAKATGIPYATLKNLNYETQQTIVYEFMMDTAQIDRIYQLTNNALAVMELDKVAKLISVPLRELRKLPTSMQERICDAYAMEYDPDSTNTELIDNIREMIADE